MSIITCPNCKSLLHQVEKTLKCLNGHSFDFAKEGYINLLLANQKKTNSPGDNKTMINAREEFLSAGYYNFLIDNIESSISELELSPTLENDDNHLLDLGCGSGYYTRNLCKEKGFTKTGIDISKIAVTKASKQDKNSTYLVGSAFGLPIVDTSIDLLLNIFSPIQLEELTRVLKPCGHFIKVIPSGDHMKEVAELVYENFTPHESSIEADIESHPMLQIVKTEVINSIIEVADQDLINFISMTPYLYKFKEEELSSLKELSVTISFKVIVGKLN